MSKKSPLEKYPPGTVVVSKKRDGFGEIRLAYQKDHDGEWYGAWGWESPVDPPESHIVVYKPGKDTDE